MVIGASEVETGTSVVVEDTGVEDTLQADTEKIGVRVDMTAMLHTSKHLPDSRSSLGWLYFKDALLKKN